MYVWTSQDIWSEFEARENGSAISRLNENKKGSYMDSLYMHKPRNEQSDEL